MLKDWRRGLACVGSNSFDLSRLNHRHAFNPGPRSNEFDPTGESPRWPLITCISGPLWRADWRVRQAEKGLRMSEPAGRVCADPA